MPEIVHSCGKTLRFPEGSEGKKGKCPSCGELVEVPRITPADAPPAPPADAPPAPPSDKREIGLAPPTRTAAEPALVLDPPPNWDQYQAYLDGKGPSPRRFVIPANLMLKTEADEAWKRAEAKGLPSKFSCPACRKTLHIRDLVCLRCGLDLRTGRTLDGEKKLSDKALEALARIPWLKDAPPPDEESGGDDDAEPSEKKKRLAAKLAKKKRRLR
jgi:hypothetical protein